MACASFGLERLQSLVKRLRLALADHPQARAALPDSESVGVLCVGIRRALILAESSSGGRRKWLSSG